MGNNTISIARDEIAAAIEYIGWDRIRAFECEQSSTFRPVSGYSIVNLVGNEADHYAGGSRPSGWASSDYTAQFLVCRSITK